MIPLCEPGGRKEGLYSQLSKLLGGSQVTTVLGTVKDEDVVAEFYKHYCHDFIREVHLVAHAESGKEYKVSKTVLVGIFASVWSNQFFMVSFGGIPRSIWSK